MEAVNPAIVRGVRTVSHLHRRGEGGEFSTAQRDRRITAGCNRRSIITVHPEMQQTTIKGHRQRWTKRVSNPFPRWHLKRDPCDTPISLNIKSRRPFPDERGNSDPVHSQKERTVANVRFRRWRLFRMRNRHGVSRFLCVEDGDKTSAREEKR
jgi:hypothetical protein